MNDDVLTLGAFLRLGVGSLARDKFKARFGRQAKVAEALAWFREINPCWEALILSQELSITKAFVRHGADVNAHNGLALANASYDGKIGIVRFLLNSGADIHARDDEALNRASYGGRIEVVRLLIERGADVRAGRDRAYHNAKLYGREKIVELLEAAIAAADKK